MQNLIWFSNKKNHLKKRKLYGKIFLNSNWGKKVWWCNKKLVFLVGYFWAKYQISSMMLLTLIKSTKYSFNFNCFFLLHISISPSLNKNTIFSFNFDCFFLLHISITPSIKLFHFLQPLMLSSWAKSLAYTELGEMGKGVIIGHP